MFRSYADRQNAEIGGVVKMSRKMTGSTPAVIISSNPLGEAGKGYGFIDIMIGRSGRLEWSAAVIHEMGSIERRELEAGQDSGFAEPLNETRASVAFGCWWQSLRHRGRGRVNGERSVLAAPDRNLAGPRRRSRCCVRLWCGKLLLPCGGRLDVIKVATVWVFLLCAFHIPITAALGFLYIPVQSGCSGLSNSTINTRFEPSHSVDGFFPDVVTYLSVSQDCDEEREEIRKRDHTLQPH